MIGGENMIPEEEILKIFLLFLLELIQILIEKYMTPSEFTIHYNTYLIFYQLLIFKKISKLKKLCYKKNRL